jgi:ppGpp synthetase/RelA/SpoT-type nucleotidyltranferase
MLAPSKVEQAVEAYSGARRQYEQFAESLASLLRTLLSAKKLDYVNVSARAKEVDSFRGKITRAGKSYVEPLSEVTDLCGVRVVCNDLATLNRISEVVRSNFDVDADNSIDKSKSLELDQFGYLSVHFVVKLNQERRQLPEYGSFADMKAEVQIRTALQHAWAALDHGLRYKAQSDVPKELQRRLYRISALLELADDEFLRLMEESERVRSEYAANVSAGQLDSVEVDSDSVDALLLGNSSLKSLSRAAEAAGIAISPNPPNQKTPWTNLVRTLHVAGIRTLKSFDEVLTRVANSSSPIFASVVKRWEAEKISPKLVLDPATLLRVAIVSSLDREKAATTMKLVKFGPLLQSILERELALSK